jgi:hypothetical protein
MEDYVAKMAGKSEAELHQYISHRAEYREEAVLAAIAELEKRGEQVADVETLRADLQRSLAQTQAEEQLHPAPVPEWANRQSSEDDEEEEAEEQEEETDPKAADAPALYSPSTVVLFSVLDFSIGGLLMLLNLIRLRRYGGAALLIGLILLASGLQVLVWSWLGIGLEWTALLFKALMALVYVYVMWPSFIGQQRYRPRGWLLPLVITIGVMLLGATLLQRMGMHMPSMK